MRRLRLIALLVAVLAGCGGVHHRGLKSHAPPVADAFCPQPRSLTGPTQGVPASRLAAGGEAVRFPDCARPAAVPADRDRARPSQSPPPRARPSQSPPQALVTDESQGLLAVVDLRSRSATLFIGIPRGPQYVAAESGVALVTSPSAGAVTLLGGDPLRVVKVLHGFGAPHVIEISPDGKHAYVTDDARGTLTVIRLDGDRVTETLNVGALAHHLASSPDQRRLWIALGEKARTIVIADTSDLEHPRVIGRFDPGFPAHDLSFSPDGRRVWISSASSPYVTVFRASDQRRLFRVSAGPPPQHIAFTGPYVYLTSGYGSTIEQVSTSTGRVIRRVRSPYGSFELDAADGFVTTASLLDGKLAIYTPRLKLLHVIKLGPTTRDVEISKP
jgi:DNA-binding beta-propeller fold protein YncE